MYTNYKIKSDSRKGGVGYEGDIMTSEIFTDNNHRKFIPLLRSGEWKEASPSWLRGKYYLDFRNEDFNQNYNILVNTLLNTSQNPREIESLAPIKRHYIGELTALKITNSGIYPMKGVSSFDVESYLRTNIGHSDGQDVMATIRAIDLKANAIYLDDSTASEDAWYYIHKYQVGSLVKATVCQIYDDSILLNLEKNIFGRLDSWDISWFGNRKVLVELFSLGQVLKVKILKISLKNKKIYFGLKQIEDNPWNRIFDEKYCLGSIINRERIAISESGLVLNGNRDSPVMVVVRSVSEKGYVDYLDKTIRSSQVRD